MQITSRPLRRIAQYLTNAVLGAVGPAALAAPASLSDAEYEELLEMAFQQGALAAGEKEIILQIIRLDRRHAREVMKGRTQMVCISDDLAVAEMAAAARRAQHRRLPIYDETPDNIVGVLNAHSLLLDPEQDLDAVIEFPSFVPESMNLLQLLKSLQRQRRGLAIVRDEFGGTAGIVTIEDILAEVVGRIHHEHEPAQAVLRIWGRAAGGRAGPCAWIISAANTRPGGDARRGNHVRPGPARLPGRARPGGVSWSSSADCA